MSDGPSTPPAAATASSHDTADWFEQTGFRFRFGWGPNGLRRLAPRSAVVVIVDVLSFSTAVDIVVGRGAVVLPYRWHDGGEDEYAKAKGAIVAAKRPGPDLLSLRPSSLVGIAPGLRLVLPSPNGSALTFAAEEAGARSVLVGSLRNATAVGRAAAAAGGVVSVIAAGERWRGTTGPLRPAIEDLLGAGAILRAGLAAGHLQPDGGADGDRAPGGGRSDPASPEARVAVAAFAEAQESLAARLADCGSGRELVDRGFEADVDLAAKLDAGAIVPTLRGDEVVDGGS